VYLMICPKCGLVLAEWSSLEARHRELSEFGQKLRTHR